MLRIRFMITLLKIALGTFEFHRTRLNTLVQVMTIRKQAATDPVLFDIYVTLWCHKATMSLAILIPGIRLVGGLAHQGRLEVYHDNQWGTVCDDNWSHDDAAVVCSELGLSGGLPFKFAQFGEGCGNIWMTETMCRRVHDDVMTWKRFPHHWHIVRGINLRIPLIKGQWCGALMGETIMVSHSLLLTVK